jgi:hypothetical protein
MLFNVFVVISGGQANWSEQQDFEVERVVDYAKEVSKIRIIE